MKIQIILDSTFYMTESQMQQYNYDIIPLTVNFNSATFVENAKNKMTIRQLFDQIDQHKKLPTTSQPTTSDFIEIYERAIVNGAQKIISLHLSSDVSGTYQGSKIAIQEIKDKHPDIEIESFDTRLAAQYASVVAFECSKVIDETGNIEFDQVQKIVDYYAKNWEISFLVDKLDYLIYGGRISKTMATAANLFNLKPMLTLKDGTISKKETVRNNSKALKLLLLELEEQLKANPDNIYQVMISHTTSEKVAERLRKQVEDLGGNQVELIPISELGIVIGNHIGKDAIGIGWIKKITKNQYS